VILISGYAVFDFGFIATRPVDDSSSDKNIGLASELKQYRERDRENVLVRNLAAAREEIALLTARENAAQAKVLEVKRIADAEQKKPKEALDENSARVQALARELASVREGIASASKPLNGGVVAQDGDSPTGSINRRIEGSNAEPAINRVVPNKQILNDVTTETPPVSSTRSAPLSAAPDDAIVGLSRPPTQPSQPQPTSTTVETPNNAATEDANALMAQTPLKPKCDVSACTRAFRSFRASDCTYQPSDGPRRLCPIGVVPSKPSGPPVAAPTSNSNAQCNVNACAAAYASFNRSDCTFQALGGPRMRCAK